MAATGLSENYILGAWILAGIVTMLGAFSIAGLAKLTNEAGGNFEYLRLCYGDFLSFLFGWAYFMILGSGSIAAVSFIFSQSFNALFHLPDPLSNLQHLSIGFIHPFADSGIKLLAIAAIILLTWFNYRGIKKGASLNNFVTIAKIAGILLLIALGLFFSGAAVHTPASPIEAPFKEVSNFSWLAIFFGVMLNAFWSYDGFSNVAAASAEIKNPKRNIPIAIITGVSIVLVLYVLINYAFMKAMPLHELASIPENEVAAIVVAKSILGNTGTILISLLILLSTFGYLNVAVLLYSRYYYRMAQEQLFFKSVAKIHPVYKTPHIALLFSMIWSSVLVLSGSFDVLTDMAVFGAFAFYVLLAIGLIKMKKKGLIKDKIPGYPYAPILFSLFIIAVLTSTFINSPVRTITGIALILSGVPFYYYFKSKKKKDKSES